MRRDGSKTIGQLELSSLLPSHPLHLSRTHHRVESRDLINPHRRQFQDPSDLVHDAQACPVVVLSLTEIEQRDHSCLLVLRRVSRDDLFGEFGVGFVEGEGDLGIKEDRWSEIEREERGWEEGGGSEGKTAEEGRRNERMHCCTLCLDAARSKGTRISISILMG